MDYGLNDCGVYTRPEIPYKVKSPKYDYNILELRIAQTEDGVWCFGYTYPNGTSPCMGVGRKDETRILTRKECIKAGLEKLREVIDRQIAWYTQGMNSNCEDAVEGYGSDLREYRKLAKVVNEWIVKEREPIQLSLFD